MGQGSVRGYARHIDLRHYFAYPKYLLGLLLLSGLFLLIFRCVQAQEAPPTALRNPGFEAPAFLEGWTTHVNGSTPEIAPDSRVVHSGRRSLRVTADAPSDTAFGQEVRLKPGRPYRLRGWVRTHALDPHGAPVYGTFQIQRPGGQGILASGPNHRGDTDWTPVSIAFQAPSGGLTRIALFFVGFGRGTGTCWFDDITLEEVDPTMTPVRVTREFLTSDPIDPFQYGQFVEYLCDLVPSMWAEKLYDGSFEGLTPYKFVYLKETDFKEKPWYPSGATNRAQYTLDHDTKVSGEVSQKIAAEAGAPATVGLSQDGVAVQSGAACVFSIYLRQEGLSGPVRVRQHHEDKVYAEGTLTPTGEWQKFRVRLVPTETDTGATLSLTFRGPGTLWLDNASLMPEATVGGWRPDVVEAVRALKPGIIRFGGSALDVTSMGDFSWKDTIGDPDHRRPFQAWGGLQPTGPGLEEIVQFCYLVGAEPLICVRFTNRTPQDAAEQVQYFNGAVDTPMGALRARNGHPEPYHIRYWQVGNELEGTDYEAGVAAFCRAMKEADPAIKLMSSYPTAGVIRNAGALLDYVCPHHYGCDDLLGKENDFAAIARLIRENAPGRDIKIGVTEWNTTAGDAGPRRAMLWTLANALACARYHNLMHRHADRVKIANRSNLINSFCSGIIQVDRSRLYKTPTYYAQQLYATLAGSRPLRLDADLPANLAPDISATLTPQGDAVLLFVVNDTLEDIIRPLDLSAFGSQGQEVTVWTLTDREHAGEPDVTNSFGDPERVVPIRSVFHAPAPKFDYRFPALSLTVLKWTDERAKH